MFDPADIDSLRKSLSTLEKGFSDLPDFSPEIDRDELDVVLNEVAGRMQENYPYHHPLYAGQMLKPPHPVARLAYAMSLWLNPNNHALDGGIASSAMEKECIATLGSLFGWEQPLGHICGGGTMANLEALWVAGRLQPGSKIVASEQTHYTHGRICQVLSLPFTQAAVAADGRMDVESLAQLLDKGDVGTVVVTLGTTGVGAFDPLPEIIDLRDKYNFRIHVDAAYGGYFVISSELGPDARQAFDRISEVDSICIDPHKHGLQPYGCGCILFRDTSVSMLYKHDSPYTYFSSGDLHLGEISLECSRPGASAVALWATQKLLPMNPGGEFSRSLDKCLLAARALWEKLNSSDHYLPLMRPEIDIVVYAATADNIGESNDRSRQIFARAAKQNLHLATIELPSELIRHYWPDLSGNTDMVTCLRSCLMKPEQLDWIDQIFSILESSAQ
ncbi:MAG: pyridoxal phosphate-dependent decarboxylase family protein [Woeseia sp.]